MFKKICWIVVSLFACTRSGIAAAAAATTVGSNNNAAATTPHTPDDLLNIALGIFQGFLQHDIELARTCVMDTMDTMNQIEVAISDLEEGTPDSVEKGIEELGQALQDFVDNGLKDCKLYADDVDEVTKAFEMISHPLSFLYHAGTNFAINRVEIGKEIKQALIDWRTDPPLYYDFGINVGEAARLVLVGNTSSTTTTTTFDSTVEVW